MTAYRLIRNVKIQERIKERARAANCLKAEEVIGTLTEYLRVARRPRFRQMFGINPKDRARDHYQAGFI